MIFVTGASGFIGKYVVKELLDQGCDVICLVRNVESYHTIGDERILEGSLSDMQKISEKMNGIDVESCIHLAWEGIPDYSYDVSERNLFYGIELLHLCKKMGIKNLIVTGSCWEYDNPQGAIRTDYPIGYDNAFKAAKNSFHMMAHAFCKENGIHLNWLRLFYVYGPGQREGSLIPYIIKCFDEGRQPELNGAYNENDFIHVEDVAKVIVKVTLNQVYSETMNVGSGKATRVLDIVEREAEKRGYKLETSRYKRNQPVSFFADPVEMVEK